MTLQENLNQEVRILILRLINKKNMYDDTADVSTNKIVTIMYDKREKCMEIRTLSSENPLSFECSKDSYNSFLTEFFKAVKKGNGLFTHTLQ